MSPSQQQESEKNNNKITLIDGDMSLRDTPNFFPFPWEEKRKLKAVRSTCPILQ